MMIERGLKIFMTGGVAMLCAFIVVGNIEDPGSNLVFVQHVLSMDTIMPVSAMASHALPIPVLWPIVFWLIVLGEAATTVLFALATVELVRARNRKARDFRAAKRFVYLGAGCGFLVWFLAFLAVGGEWFAMWQSQVWNGQQAAFRIVDDDSSGPHLRRPAGRRALRRAKGKARYSQVRAQRSQGLTHERAGLAGGA